MFADENRRDRAAVRELAGGGAGPPAGGGGAERGTLARDRRGRPAFPARQDGGVLLSVGASAARVPGPGASGGVGVRYRSLASPLRRAVAAHARGSRSPEGPPRSQRAALAGARHAEGRGASIRWRRRGAVRALRRLASAARSEEHTSELQSRGHLVCRLLLEKKKGNI